MRSVTAARDRAMSVWRTARADSDAPRGRAVRAGGRARAVERGACARAARRQVVLRLLLVADYLHVPVAREQARLVASKHKVGHHLAKALAARRESRVLLAQEGEGRVDGLRRSRRA
eukprot:5011507-Prymnesium_polylepis.1